MSSKSGRGSALVEGDRAMGPVGATYGASLAARKAEKAGSCTVGVVNSDHICMTGYYAERIARAGCVGIVTGVTQPLVHPFGGVERLMGTNPFSIAVPRSGDEPVLLDFATSAIPYGMILKASVTGEPIPEGRGSGGRMANRRRMRKRPPRARLRLSGSTKAMAFAC